jgi:hypothetical protein
MQTPISPSLDSAIRELGSAIGQEHVLTSPDVLGEYGKATFETSQRIALVVLPASSAQLQEVARIAARLTEAGQTDHQQAHHR